MPLWQILLIALVGAWALQAAGTYYQMRHYRSVMGDVSARWADGFVGAGSAKSTFGRGVILLLVVSPDRIIRRLAVMQGRSVFAKFKSMPDLEGQPLESLRSRPPFADSGQSKALAVAIAQIEKAAATRQGAAA
jgi:glucitol operon activator protein